MINANSTRLCYTALQFVTMTINPQLHQLRSKLQEIYTASADFHPLSLKPPVLDSSVEAFNNGPPDDSPWAHQEQIPGLKQLREHIRLDLDVLGKVGIKYFLQLLKTPIIRDDVPLVVSR
jgi:hypothetical protein